MFWLGWPSNFEAGLTSGPSPAPCPHPGPFSSPWTSFQLLSRCALDFSTPFLTIRQAAPPSQSAGQENSCPDLGSSTPSSLLHCIPAQPEQGQPCLCDAVEQCGRGKHSDFSLQAKPVAGARKQHSTERQRREQIFSTWTFSVPSCGPAPHLPLSSFPAEMAPRAEKKATKAAAADKEGAHFDCSRDSRGCQFDSVVSRH